MDKELKNILSEYIIHLKSKTISKDELYDFISSKKPDLNDNTFRWYISQLKNNHILSEVKNGLYKWTNKPPFRPLINEFLVGLNDDINKAFTETKFCCWSTDWLNEFSRHQTATNYYLVEIEKDMIDSVFNYLMDNTEFHVFINPDEQTLNRYIQSETDPVILKSLISRSPLTKHKISPFVINIPSLEKIIVDLFCDTELFNYWQGEEKINIYRNILKQYDVNFSTITSYAKRRNREKEIKDFLKVNFSHIMKELS
jgi:hypothetical protein